MKKYRTWLSKLQMAHMILSNVCDLLQTQCLEEENHQKVNSVTFLV